LIGIVEQSSGNELSRIKMTFLESLAESNPNRQGHAFPAWGEPNPNDHMYWNKKQTERSGIPPKANVGIFGLSVS
jgi:hypothetical protein